MYDYSSAVAKLRGLELITEAAADRRAASLRRTRRNRDRNASKGPSVAMGSTGARPATAKVMTDCGGSSPVPIRAG
jgi:inactivated superfamily I helicase